MKKKTILTLAAGAASLALGLSGCAAQGGSAGANGDGGDAITTLKIGNFLDVQGWDPANGVIGFDGPYMSAVYDPLVRIDKSGEPQPALATEWSYSKDRTTLTMDLRHGVTFTDGEKFNADAAVTNIEHLRQGVMPGDTYSSVTDVRAVDDDTIELTLGKRDDSLLYLMGAGQSWMASPAAIESGALDEAPVGSGPYVLDEERSTAGASYTFTKVKDQWAGDLFPFNTVVVKVIRDQTARQNAMLSGQTNVSYGLAENLAQAKQQGWNIQAEEGSWVGLQFADRSGALVPALGDTRVRQAINHAFDGAAILKTIGEGAGTASSQVFPTSGDIAEKKLDARYGYDVAKAKKLMAEAGYPDGFAVKMPMAPAFQPWQAIVTQNLKAIGITVDWVSMQMPDYQTNAGTYPMFIAVINLDSSAPTTVARQVSTRQWFNPRVEESLAAYPEVQKLITAANSVEGDAQTEAIRALNEKLTDLAWFDVWYQSENIYFSTPGIVVQPVAGLMFPTLNFIQPE